MPHLPPRWAAHLESGASNRLGACGPDGRPEICRALAARSCADGCIEVLVAADVGARIVAAVQATQRIAHVSAHPGTNIVLHTKGRDAQVLPAQPEHMALLERCRDRFIATLEPYGFTREQVMSIWYDVDQPLLRCVRFTPFGAWDQTPGIGAGGVIEMLDEPGSSVVEAVAPQGESRAMPTRRTPIETKPQSPLELRTIRRLLEGVIPPAMCSVADDGTPHVNYLSHAEYVDDDHVALTFQFFNRSRANVLATRRIALCVEDPVCGTGVMLRLHYLRTDTEGPVFERLRAKLAGIAAHSGMEKVFHLRGADVYRVEGLEWLDVRHGLPSLASRCDLAGGVRRLGQALAEAVDMAALLRTFLAGLETELRIDHAIVWMLDEQRQGLYSLGSIGYADPGTGAEVPLADAGLAGVAVREGVPIRIGHMTSQYDYALMCRERAAQLGLEAMVQRMVPLPGLGRPRSQLAVPLRARGRTVGALLVESDRDQFFGYDDEDALAAVGAQLALGLATLRSDDAGDDKPVAATAKTVPQGSSTSRSTNEPLRIRHYPRDHSVFVDDEYLIRGVAGAILAKVVRDRIATGVDTFTTRELRLAGGDLRLPEVQDNLGVRLLLLERRLAEGDFGLRLERVARGRYRLLARGPLEIVGG